MERNMLKHGTGFLMKQKRRKLWHKVVGILACLVVFCTSYALILPAITMEKTTYCGMEEHEHDESCYTTTEVLICGLDEGTIAETAGEVLETTVDGEGETSEKTEDEVSVLPEVTNEVHVHTEACYQYENALNCTLEEHAHTLACYSDKNADVETAAEWESGLPALTGDRVSNLIRVAESQVGYTESSANYEVAETDVLKGYTRYGAWYGNPYGDWSGMFAAFCLNYAGISQDIFPCDANCQSWANILAQRGMYADAGSYMPKAGDIAFLDTDGTSGINHIGIITSVSADGTITVVAGDFQNSVQYASYAANGGNVTGYGILPVEESTEEQIKEIDPENTIRVDISQSSDIKENMEGTGDIVITHATAEGTEVISEVEQTEKEDGYVTASFETESFSDFGTISAGQSVTIGIGDTVTLQGCSGNRNNWSISPEECVTINTNGNNAVITGVAVGTVTITHTYNNKGANESFTVIVTDSEGSGTDDDDETEIEAAGTGYTVTVKGNKKVLTDGVTLHVEDYGNTESDYQEYYDALVEDMQAATSSVIDNENFDFLHMYHIYLTKDGVEGEYIPESNINLQVTITYDNIPDGWPSGNGNLYVGHYKKNATGIIENKGFTDSTGIKQIRVSGNSVTFHIQSFSVFPVAVLRATGMEESDELIQTTQNTDVRLHKWVEETDVENEFLVHMSIDTTSVTQKYDEFLKNATYIAGSASHFPGGESAGDLGSLQGTEKSTNGNKPYSITLTYQGKVVGSAVVNMEISNGCLYLKLDPNGSTSDNVYIALAELKKEQTVNTELTEEAYEMLVQHVESSTHTDGLSVTDTMGPSIIYLDSVSGDGSVTPGTSVSEVGTTITWTPVIKSGLIGTPDAYDSTKTWYENAAELTYRIRLDVQDTHFKNGASEIAEGKSLVENNLTPEQAANLSVNAVNEKATLTYDDNQTLDFPVPYVRGTTYTFSFLKVDANDNSKTLEGAEFKIVSSDNKYVFNAISDENGVVTFSGIPWGIYTLTETKAPEAYAINAQSITLPIIGYVEDMKDGILDCHKYVSGMDYEWMGMLNDDGDWVYTKTSSSDWKVTNTSGVELPSTGGPGTLFYTFGGLGLILISGLMYGYSMRRKRERRSM